MVDDTSMSELYYYYYFNTGDIEGVRIAQWVDRLTLDGKVASSNPDWSDGRIFFSRINYYSVSVPPPCYCSGT